MTVIATRNKSVLSSVVADDINALVHDYNYAHNQPADEAADTVYEVGTVLYWKGTNWSVLTSGDFTTNALNEATSTTATAGKTLAVVVGFDSLGDKKTETVTTAGRNVVVLYQGAVNVKESGLKFDAGLNATQIANAKADLAKEGIKLIDTANAVAVTYYNA